MELTGRLRRWALARPRVLIVAAPGSDRRRCMVEAEVDRRGWRLAMSPADTDLLLTVGNAGPGLSAAADVLWSQVPRPRHRTAIIADDRVGTQLEAAATALLDQSAYAEDDTDPAALLSGRQPHTAGIPPPGHGGHEMGGHDMGGHDMGGHDIAGHAGHDMGGHDMAGHEMGGHEMGGQDMGGPDMGGHDMAGHDMGGHDMGGPDMAGHGGHHMQHGGEVAGLPMAGTAPDRDGLELDELKVTMGPVLPGWPPGLVLRGSVQGDVLNDVQLSWIDEFDPAGNGEHQGVTVPIRALDLLARFLLVAGWPTAAREARTARDDLSGSGAASVEHGLRSAALLARRVKTSSALAWSVRGLGVHPPGPVTGSPTTEDGRAGDVWDRVRRWCEIAGHALTAADADSLVVELAALQRLLDGVELAAARLIVASFDVEPVPVMSSPEVVGG